MRYGYGYIRQIYKGKNKSLRCESPLSERARNIFVHILFYQPGVSSRKHKSKPTSKKEQKVKNIKYDFLFPSLIYKKSLINCAVCIQMYKRM